MPSYLVKQPDGKYAMFSSMIEDFTLANMNAEEAIEECRDGLDSSQLGDGVHKYLLGKAEADAPAWHYDGSAPPGQRRWMGAIAAIQRVHGEAKAQRRALLDFSEDEE